MTSVKMIAISYMLVVASVWAGAPDATEANATSPLIQSRFISVKRNTLANPIKGLIAQVGKLSVDGLVQYTLLLQPDNGMPLSGWPVIIFNHGFHPEPSMNGRRTVDGLSDRPGDYYRQIPQTFARQGFLVVAPDYRGHNNSSGTEFTLQQSSPDWYTRDVLGIVNALQSTGSANMDHLFILGHSMGAQVTLQAAAALGGNLKGSSIWSTSLPKRSPTATKPSEYATAYSLHRISGPINFHHAKHDKTAPFDDSTMIIKQLAGLGKTTELYSYLSDNHLFIDNNLQLAIARDIAFFRRLMSAKDGPAN